MHMLYNSESYAVVLFDVATDAGTVPGGAALAGASLSHGGYEIVDKFARKEIFIQGVLAENFQTEVQALIEKSPSQEAFDEFLGRYTSLMQHPLVLH